MRLVKQHMCNKTAVYRPTRALSRSRRRRFSGPARRGKCQRSVILHDTPEIVKNADVQKILRCQEPSCIICRPWTTKKYNTIGLEDKNYLNYSLSRLLVVRPQEPETVTCKDEWSWLFSWLIVFVCCAYFVLILFVNLPEQMPYEYSNSTFIVIIRFFSEYDYIWFWLEELVYR